MSATHSRPLVTGSYLREALAGSDEAPLSVRRAMLVVMLLDNIVDELARRDGGDPLRSRDAIAHQGAELELALDVAAHRVGGPVLVVEEVEVPLTAYAALSSAEFMISLYNDLTVPRLLVAMPGGTRLDAHAILHGAVTAVARIGF